MLECLGGSLAFGAGGVDIAVPGGVGAEVALPRSHLVEAACGKPVLAHERVRLERGAVWVPGWVRRGLFPLFEEKTPALELDLGVVAAREGSG